MTLCGLLAGLLAAPASPQTTLGIQGLYLSGTHLSDSGSAPFSGAAALLEARQAWRSADVFVEAAPSTGSHGYLQTPSGVPQPYTSLSIFDAVARLAIGPTGRFWAGGGIAIANQITTLGSPPEAAASRVVGSRFEVLAALPAGKRGTFELRAATMPSMHGAVSFHITFPVPPNEASETAEATDVSAQYLLHDKVAAYGIGVRAINYVAHFVNPATFADRNTALGVFLQARFTVAK